MPKDSTKCLNMQISANDGGKDGLGENVSSHLYDMDGGFQYKENKL